MGAVASLRGVVGESLTEQVLFEQSPERGEDMNPVDPWDGFQAEAGTGACWVCSWDATVGGEEGEGSWRGLRGGSEVVEAFRGCVR